MASDLVVVDMLCWPTVGMRSTYLIKQDIVEPNLSTGLPGKCELIDGVGLTQNSVSTGTSVNSLMLELLGRQVTASGSL